MNTGLSAGQNGNGAANGTDVVDIAEGIKNFLFWLNAGFFALFMIIALLRFTGFGWFAETPSLLILAYQWILAFYIPAKEVHKAKCNGGDFQRKRGEIFFVAWWSIFFALLVPSSFHIGHKEVLDEMWPLLTYISILFAGNEAVRFRNEIISLTRSTVAAISASLPVKTKGGDSAPPPVAPTA